MNSKEVAQAKRDKLFEKATHRTFHEETLSFIEWVTLAPSTHNTQPWRFSVSSKGKVVVSIDKAKAVEMADPEFRDMFISAGALLRHVEIIGAMLSNIEDLSVSPDLESGTVAEFTLKPSKKWSNFLSSKQAKDISTRQNYRGQYLAKTINPKDIEHVAQRAISETQQSSRVAFRVYDIKSQQAKKLSQLIKQGIADAYKNPKFRTEVANHINSNFSKKATGLHGYSLTMNPLLSVVLPAIIRKKDIGSKLSELNLRSILGSQGIIVVSSENDSPADWVDAGKVMMELTLRLNSKGIQTSIYAAPIEMGSLRSKVHDVLSPTKQYAQLMFTYGYPGKDIGFSHRQSPASVTTFR